MVWWYCASVNSVWYWTFCQLLWLFHSICQKQAIPSWDNCIVIYWYEPPTLGYCVLVANITGLVHAAYRAHIHSFHSTYFRCIHIGGWITILLSGYMRHTIILSVVSGDINLGLIRPLTYTFVIFTLCRVYQDPILIIRFIRCVLPEGPAILRGADILAAPLPLFVKSCLGERIKMRLVIVFLRSFPTRI